MDNDTQTSTRSENKPELDRLDRRQFFNGLGKWSLAVIVAVTALRERSHEGPDVIGSRFDAPTDGQENRRQLMAKKKRPHGDQPHIDEKHSNIATPHEDYYRRKVPTGAGPKAPSGGTRTQ
jgi:hypothetical protein